MIADRSRLAANNLAALIRQVVVTETILSSAPHGIITIAHCLVVMERF